MKKFKFRFGYRSFLQTASAGRAPGEQPRPWPGYGPREALLEELWRNNFRECEGSITGVAEEGLALQTSDVSEHPPAAELEIQGRPSG